MSNELLEEMTLALEDGDVDAVAAYVQQALDGGLEPLKIIEGGLVPGMDTVGEKFACGEYFLPQLVVAGRAMQAAMQILEPSLLSRGEEARSAGTIVLGTVKGDIHEIGKSLVGIMLQANGFKVYDLGIDVPSATFVAKVRETKANILGLSALLTTTMTAQRQVIDELTEAGIRDQVKVIVGGAPISQAWCDSIGADGYAEDAMGAVKLAKKLVA
jgi:corrinoid protein of di/trimethylamine methyltransferase